MKRLAAVAITAAALISTPLSTAHGAVGGDHTSGSPGLYNPRDQLRAHTGVTCHYRPDGTLHSVSVITPKVQPLRIYTSAHRRSYVMWAAQAEQKSHGHWLAVGGWHRAPEKLLKAKATWQILKPLASFGVPGAKANHSYRVLERIQWKNYNSHTALVGSVVHAMGAYYYGPKTVVATSCHDQRPTATSFTTSVLAGQSLSLDVLSHAKDADHDPLRLAVLSAEEDGGLRTVSPHSDGVLTMATSTDEAGKTVIVRYVAIDPAGVRSAPGTLTVHIRDETPGAPRGISVTSVRVTEHNDTAQPTKVEADLVWSAPATGLPPACYDVRAVIMVSSDGGNNFSPNASAPQTVVCNPASNLQDTQLVPDNVGLPNYVQWQVRAVSKTRLTGPWTSITNQDVPNELTKAGPDAFQALRYSGFWIQSLDNVTPSNCNQNDEIATQDPSDETEPVGTKVTVAEYGEVAC